MKSTSSITVAGLAAISLAVSAVALNIEQRAVSGKRHLGLDFIKQSRDVDVFQADRRRAIARSLLKRIPKNTENLQRRQKVVQEILDNGVVGYYANISIGTPAQAITLHIDTGSSDIWTNSELSSFCEQEQDNCVGGSFNAQKSKTYETQYQDGFDISYVDKTGASGDYFSDVFKIGGATVKNQIMGLASRSTISTGVMGIGYDVNEAYISGANGDPSNTPYSTLVDNLVSDGFINTKAYSLWLNDLDANTGSVLFGGIDSDKYQGELKGVPIVPDPDTGDYREFTVNLSSIQTRTSNGATKNIAIDTFPILLDAGATLLYLPQEVAQQVANTFGAVASTNNAGSYLVKCDVLNNANNAGLTFGFGTGSGGPNVFVPLDEIVLLNSTTTENVCQFGIHDAITGGGASIGFGDIFLRSAYVTYDLDNNIIYLGQTVFNATSSNVLEITAASGVPTNVAGATVTSSSGGASSTHKSAANVSFSAEYRFLLSIPFMLIACMVGGGSLLL